MIDWNALTLFFYIQTRVMGFLLTNPFFARNGVPNIVRAGLALLCSLVVFSTSGGTAPLPGNVVELAFRLFAEFGVGIALNFVIRFFFFIPEQAGEQIDTQMGLSMARSYDPSFQSSATVNATLMSQLATLLFFLANGHVTMLRILLTSGELVPFGTASLGPQVADRALALFVECLLLAVKMGFPVLGAELLGQIGMGVLMKVIPQINVFAINIELKVIIGLVMISMLLAPISSFLLETESYMLTSLRELLSLMAG